MNEELDCEIENVSKIVNKQDNDTRIIDYFDSFLQDYLSDYHLHLKCFQYYLMILTLHSNYL